MTGPDRPLARAAICHWCLPAPVLSYYTELAKSVEPGLWVDRDAEGARALEAEHDDLRAALGWALARPVLATPAFRCRSRTGWTSTCRGRNGAYSRERSRPAPHRSEEQPSSPGE